MLCARIRQLILEACMMHQAQPCTVLTAKARWSNEHLPAARAVADGSTQAKNR